VPRFDRLGSFSSRQPQIRLEAYRYSPHRATCPSWVRGVSSLQALDRTGIFKIVRRLVRQRVERVSPITGEAEAYVGTTQTSSLYSLHRPGAWADHLPVPRGRSAPFPCARQLIMLERMVATWKVSPSLKQSLNSRLKPTPQLTQLADIIPGKASRNGAR